MVEYHLLGEHNRSAREHIRLLRGVWLALRFQPEPRRTSVARTDDTSHNPCLPQNNPPVGRHDGVVRSANSYSPSAASHESKGKVFRQAAWEKGWLEVVEQSNSVLAPSATSDHSPSNLANR